MKDGTWVARKSERLRVTINAACRFGADGEQGVTLVNITPEGCCMTTGGATYQRGLAVLVRLDSGEALTGVIRWSDGARAGVEFDHVLPPSRVEFLRRHQSTFLSDTQTHYLGGARSVL